MEHPKAVGDRSTLAIMLALSAADYAVYLPFGENTRCDLIIDDGAEISRVQCKTGRLRNGAVGKSTIFGVYCRDTGSVYLVPIDALGARWQAALRVEPARNFQQKRVLQARQYEIGRVDLATAEPGARAGASRSSA